MSEPNNIVLNVNGIEVIYNHVILVLKGVSLNVPEGKIVALLGAMERAKPPRCVPFPTCCAASAVRSPKARLSCVASVLKTCHQQIW